jgi:hypothetical protein
MRRPYGNKEYQKPVERQDNRRTTSEKSGQRKEPYQRVWNRSDQMTRQERCGRESRHACRLSSSKGFYSLTVYIAAPSIQFGVPHLTDISRSFHDRLFFIKTRQTFRKQKSKIQCSRISSTDSRHEFSSSNVISLFNQ